MHRLLILTSVALQLVPGTYVYIRNGHVPVFQFLDSFRHLLSGFIIPDQLWVLMGALKDQNRHAEYNQAIKPEKNIQ